MRAPLSARAAGRRFVGLTALRWLPVGVTTPVVVLLASSRGLSPADIGFVFAVYSVVVLLLELPTGGLADAIGTRPVLVLSGLAGAAGTLLLVGADDVATFVLAEALRGVGRALDSGPLEAWYVDTVRAADAHTDVTPGLSRAGAADGAGLCLGAVAGGLLPLLAGGAGDEALVLPVLVAAALTLVSVVAVAALVVPVPGPEGTARGSGVAALREGVRAVPAVVRDTAVLVSRDRLLRRLLAVSALVGATLAALELFGPLRLAELTGSRTEGSAVLGVVMAISFAAAGAGALLAPRVRRLAGGSAAAGSAGLTLAGALAVAAVPLGGPVVLGCLFAVFYATNAAAWPLWKGVLHGQVGTGQRATALSASSLALMSGALLGSLLLPRLTGEDGTTAGFLAAGGALLLVAGVSLGLRTRTPAGAGAGGT